MALLGEKSEIVAIDQIDLLEDNHHYVQLH